MEIKYADGRESILAAGIDAASNYPGWVLGGSWPVHRLSGGNRR